MKTVTVQLSESSVKRYLKDAEVRELKDPRYPLRLRFNQARTGGSWYLVRYVRGHAVWQRLGKYPMIQVKTVIDHIQTVVVQGDESAALEKFSLVSDLLCWYLTRFERDRSISDKRKASVATAINKHLIPMLGDQLIGELGKDVIDQSLIWPLQVEYSATYVKQILGILKTATKTAAKLDVLSNDQL